MAGRKAKTATAAKPKATSKAARQVKAPVKPKGGAKAKVSATDKAPAKKTIQKKAAKKAPVKSPVKKAAIKKPVARKVPTKPKKPVKAVDKVVSAARTVKKSVSQTTSAADAKILHELGDLAKFIRAAKREIAAIRPDDVKDEYLPKAADELDAVVEATADATNVIMDACEVVEGVMSDVSGEVSTKLMDATTRIYEACTFQDITGQRIGKVVVAMKHIEERIDALIGAFGGKNTRPKKKTVQTQSSAPLTANTKGIADADLLEGPQLGDKAKSQSEIDDLFASFD